MRFVFLSVYFVDLLIPRNEEKLITTIDDFTIFTSISNRLMLFLVLYYFIIILDTSNP
jgi:hypothetical protein